MEQVKQFTKREKIMEQVKQFTNTEYPEAGNVPAILSGDEVLLALAARRGYMDMLEALIAKGADVCSNDDYTLQVAAHHGQTAVVRYLLQRTEARAGSNNNQALCSAAGLGHLEVVVVLINCGADENAQNGEPLYQAALHGHDAVVRVLLRAGADPFALNGRAFRAAVTGNHTGVALAIGDQMLACYKGGKS